MSVLFLGNCQVNALRGLSREMFPNLPATFRTITPYWGDFDEAATRAELAEADLVVAQSIENPTTAFNYEDVRASARGQVVFVPYVYVDGLASLEIIASKGKSVVKGAEILLQGQDGRKPIHIFQDLCDGKIDMQNFERIDASLRKTAAKEDTACDIRISDYLAETILERPTLYGINHPTQHVVFEMFRRLCAHLGWQYDPHHQDCPVVWGRRALPAAQRAFTPMDAARLGTRYDCDAHWYGQAHKMVNLAIKAEERRREDAAA